MSLKKKIALSFFISAFIIAILAAFEYVNFIEIRKEIRYLEITDTLNRKSLQLRRHEKNYFLYSPKKADEEAAAVHDYLSQLKDMLAQNPHIDQADQLSLRSSMNEYERRFIKIEAMAKKLTGVFGAVRAATGEMVSTLLWLKRPSWSGRRNPLTFSLWYSICRASILW